RRRQARGVERGSHGAAGPRRSRPKEGSGVTTIPSPSQIPPSWGERARGAVNRRADTIVKFIERLGTSKPPSNPEQKPGVSASPFARRPTDWTGYWSARPLQEALDPVASRAEPTDRDGRPARWRLSRSPLFALLRPAGLEVGALALAVVAFR